jgi:class 3 adenylate cyclase
MNLSRLGWIAAKLLIVLIIPTALYVWLGQAIFASHLKTVVTNDPDAGLSRSISALKIALDEEYQVLLSQINHTTDKDWLQKALQDPDMTPDQYHQLGVDVAGYLQRPLLILTNKNGGVLFDTIGLPKAGTGPAPTPTLAPLDSYVDPNGTPTPDSPIPMAFFSAKTWPGIAEALERNTEMGLTTYNNQYYLSVSAPIVYKKKIIGALLLGMKLNNDVLANLKTITQNEVAFYANNHVQASTFPASASSEVEKTAFAPRHSAILMNDHNFLWDDVPINDLDQAVGGHFFIFQPIHESITLDGSTLKAMALLGVAFVLVMTVIGLWYILDLLAPLRFIIRQAELVKDNHIHAAFPIKRQDQWGDLARAIHEMIQNLKDKERVSLVLGKVVSPQATQKILAEKNYFAIKGERRECTILQAQIKGFNTLSQNMTPEVLVEVLNHYLSLINQIVFKHEGMIDKFVGDTAIAVWGAPFTHEDKEIRAVRAALEIQEAVRDINISRIQNGHTPFNLGIGIHTGLVVSGNLGSDQFYDYSVIGEALQTADKLCVMAAPDQVIVSEETFEKIQALVKAVPANAVVVPGAKQPLKTYEITEFL